MLINNATHQRETLSERPIRLILNWLYASKVMFKTCMAVSVKIRQETAASNKYVWVIIFAIQKKMLEVLPIYLLHMRGLGNQVVLHYIETLDRFDTLLYSNFSEQLNNLVSVSTKSSSSLSPLYRCHNRRTVHVVGKKCVLIRVGNGITQLRKKKLWKKTH